MKMFDGQTVAVPMVKIVFEDLREFSELEKLAAHLGMGKDWPILMIRNYLLSHKGELKA